MTLIFGAQPLATLQPDEGAAGSGTYALIAAAREDSSLSDVVAYHDALIAAQNAGDDADLETILAKLRRDYPQLSESNAWAIRTPDGARIPVLTPVFVADGTVCWTRADEAREFWRREPRSIELHWADAARHYLELLERAPVPVDREETRDLATTIEYMFCWMDVPDPHWTENCWCDGVIIEKAAARDQQTLEVMGYFMWGPGGADFVDPLFFSIRLMDDRSGLCSIEIKLGDANCRRLQRFDAGGFHKVFGQPSEWRSWFVLVPDPTE